MRLSATVFVKYKVCMRLNVCKSKTLRVNQYILFFFVISKNTRTFALHSG